jgi:hypothetical protein
MQHQDVAQEKMKRQATAVEPLRRLGGKGEYNTLIGGGRFHIRIALQSMILSLLFTISVRSLK